MINIGMFEMKNMLNANSLIAKADVQVWTAGNYDRELKQGIIY